MAYGVEASDFESTESKTSFNYLQLIEDEISHTQNGRWRGIRLS